jgi:hypothetical protein
LNYREGDIVVCVRHINQELNGKIARVVSINLNGISHAKIDVGVVEPVLRGAYFGSLRSATDTEALAYRLGVRTIANKD